MPNIHADTQHANTSMNRVSHNKTPNKYKLNQTKCSFDITLHI